MAFTSFDVLVSKRLYTRRQGTSSDIKENDVKAIRCAQLTRRLIKGMECKVLGQPVVIK
jgi:hypothetical protein